MVIDSTGEVETEHQVQAIVHELRKNEVKEAYLIGLSWGAILALLTAEQCPEQIKGMVLVGAGRRIKTPRSLNFLMSLPFPGFVIGVFLFLLIFPMWAILDRKGYRQKYGGVGVLFRLGWKKTHKIYNRSLLRTAFEGKVQHPTLFFNLVTDFLVDAEEINDLATTSSCPHKCQVRFIDPPDPSHIHFTHELDPLLIEQVREFGHQYVYKQ